MLRHTARLTILVLALLVPVALVGDLRAEPAIPVPPQQVSYTASPDGALLRWWQASNANVVVLLNACTHGNDWFIGSETGRPGWHTRAIRLERGTLTSCVKLNEFMGSEQLGSYGPFPFVPELKWLPSTSR